MTRQKASDQLRSAGWFAPDDFRSFGHRPRMNPMGYAAADYVDTPLIAIIGTWSDLNQCDAHFKHRVGDVKRGILQGAGCRSIRSISSLRSTRHSVGNGGYIDLSRPVLETP